MLTAMTRVTTKTPQTVRYSARYKIPPRTQLKTQGGRTEGGSAFPHLDLLTDLRPGP